MGFANWIVNILTQICRKMVNVYIMSILDQSAEKWKFLIEAQSQVNTFEIEGLFMNTFSDEPIGLILATGKFPPRVAEKFDKLFDTHCVAISELTTIDTLKNEVERIPAAQPTKIAQYLQSKGVKRVAFAGDLGLARTTWAPLGMGSSDTPEINPKDIAEGNRSRVEGLLTMIEHIMSAHGIECTHLNDLVPDFKISEDAGWLIKPTGKRAHIEEMKDQLCSHLQHMRHKTEISFSHTSMVFDGINITAEAFEDTDNMLRSVAAEKAKNKTAIRSFTKIGTSDLPINISAPGVGINTFERCASAGVDLVILDHAHCISTETERWKEFCRENGISVYAASGRELAP